MAAPQQSQQQQGRGMSLRIDVSLADEAQIIPRLGQFIARLKNRSGLNEAIARRALNLTRDWLIEIANERHDTARRLGAAPSGHWAQAAEKTSAESDATSASITISQPGISRAAGDVTIKPGPGKKYLTIPRLAAAYNKRAASVEGLSPRIGKKGGVLVDASGNVWYALVRQVTQKQDRTLLPSNAAYRLAAVEGARDYVGYLLARSPNAPNS